MLTFLYLQLAALSFARAESTGNFWAVLNVDHELRENWKLHFDGNIRQTADILVHRQNQVRFNVDHKTASGVSFGLGYVYQDNQPWNTRLERNGYENRTFQQISGEQLLASGKLSHRFRLEQRFQNSGPRHDYHNRARYQIKGSFPLDTDGLGTTKRYVVAAEEFFFNVGEGSDGFYQQNRLFAGLGFNIDQESKTKLEAGYQWQETAAGSSTPQLDTHCLLLTLYTTTAAIDGRD